MRWDGTRRGKGARGQERVAIRDCATAAEFLLLDSRFSLLSTFSPHSLPAAQLVNVAEPGRDKGYAKHAPETLNRQVFGEKPEQGQEPNDS